MLFKVDGKKDKLFHGIFYLQSTDVYICVCILCKYWHIYTGSSCFVLDPFGFQGILNVNFIEALAEHFILLAVEMQN